MYIRRFNPNTGWIDQTEEIVNLSKSGYQALANIVPYEDGGMLLFSTAEPNSNYPLFYRRLDKNGAWLDKVEKLLFPTFSYQSLYLSIHKIEQTNQYLFVSDHVGEKDSIVCQIFDNQMSAVHENYLKDFEIIRTKDIYPGIDRINYRHPYLTKVNDSLISLTCDHYLSVFGSDARALLIRRLGDNGKWIDPGFWQSPWNSSTFKAAQVTYKITDQIVGSVWTGRGAESVNDGDNNVYINKVNVSKVGQLSGGEEQIANTQTAGYQGQVAVENFNEEVVVISWSSLSDEQENIYLRRISTNGTWLDPVEKAVNTHDSRFNRESKLAKIDDSTMLVTWWGWGIANNATVLPYMRRLHINGSWLDTTESIISVETQAFQFYPWAAKLNNDTILLAWAGYNREPVTETVFVRRLSTNYSWIDSNAVIASTRLSNDRGQKRPHIHAIDNEVALVSWSEVDFRGRAAAVIEYLYARRFHARSGWIDKEDFLINSANLEPISTLGVQHTGVQLDNNTLLIAWEGARIGGMEAIGMKVLLTSENLLRAVSLERFSGNDTDTKSRLLTNADSFNTRNQHVFPFALSFKNGDFAVFNIIDNIQLRDFKPKIQANCFYANGTQYANMVIAETNTDYAKPSAWEVSSDEFVVSWLSGEKPYANFVAQRFDKKDCRAKSSLFFITNSTTPQISFDVISGVGVKDNRFVVAWQTDSGVKTAYFDHKNEKIAETTQLNAKFPFLTKLQDNDVLLASTYLWGEDGNILLQRFQVSNDTLQLKKEIFPANSAVVDHLTNEEAQLAPLDNGGFVLVWQRHFADGSKTGILTRAFDTNNNPVGEEFILNEYRTDVQERPRIVKLAQKLAVVWQSWGQAGPTSADSDVYIALLTRTGSYDSVFSNRLVNTITTNNQMNPVVFGTNVPIVAWQSNHILTSSRGNVADLHKNALPYQIRMQRFNNQLNLVDFEESFRLSPLVFLNQKLNFTEDIPLRLQIKPTFMTNRANVTVKVLFPRQTIGATIQSVASLSITPAGSAIPKWDPAAALWHVFGSINDVAELLQNTFLETAADFHGSFNATIIVDDGLSQLQGWLFGQGLAIDDKARYIPLSKQSLLEDESWQLDLDTQFFDPDCATESPGVYNTAQCFPVSYQLPDTVLWRQNTSDFLQALTRPSWLTITESRWLNAKPSSQGEWRFNVSAYQPGDSHATYGLLELDVLPNTDNSAKVIGAAVGVSAAVAALGAGVLLIFCYQKHKKDQKSRQGERFANALRQQMKLTDLDNYDSVRGQFYLTATRVLEDELIQQGVTNEQLLESALMSKVITAIHQTIMPTSTLLGYTKMPIKKLHDNATEIARLATSNLDTKVKEVTADTDSIEMDMIDNQTTTVGNTL